MADNNITVASYEQIATILSKLLTNYSNIALKYYDIFYNSTPMDVNIQLYNETGDITTYTIPNRAKDFRYVRNGSGDPSGVVTAPIGTIYQDTTNGDLYIKQLGTDMNGWIKVGSNENLLIYPGNPEGALEASKATLCVDTANAGLYIKTTSTGNTGWELISANTSLLANKNLDNLSTAGEAHFANPALGNLDSTGQAIINGKENVINKVTTITSSSNDTQYPSAKATHTFTNNLVTTATTPLANKDLSNLNSTGEFHFVGLNQIRSGILSAPNGLATRNGNTITLPAGTIILAANGMNADKTLKNVRATLSVAKINTVTYSTAVNGTVLYDLQQDVLVICNNTYFYTSTTAPSTANATAIWWNPNTNIYSYIDNNAWVNSKMLKVATFATNASGVITSFTAEKVMYFIDENKIETRLSEVTATILAALPVIEYY